MAPAQDDANSLQAQLLATSREIILFLLVDVLTNLFIIVR